MRSTLLGRKGNEPTLEMIIGFVIFGGFVLLFPGAISSLVHYMTSTLFHQLAHGSHRSVTTPAAHALSRHGRSVKHAAHALSRRK